MPDREFDVYICDGGSGGHYDYDAEITNHFQIITNLRKLKRLHALVIDEMEEDRSHLRHKFYPLFWEVHDRLGFFEKLELIISNWQGQYPDLRKMFRQKEMDWLLAKCTHLKNVLNFVARCGYNSKQHHDEAPSALIGDDVNKARSTLSIHRLQLTAARNDDYSFMIRDLFNAYDRSDVNCTDESSYTPFHVACITGLESVVKKFFKFGEDPNCPVARTGDAPLHLALDYGRKKVAELLLRRGADPNLANDRGSTPLHVVCQKRNDRKRDGNVLGLAKMLFDVCDYKHQPLEVDARDKLGRTPLHLALAEGHKRLAKLLLKHGADPNLTDDGGATPLHVICRGFHDNHDLADKFFRINDKLNQQVRINARDKLGRTPLHLALLFARPGIKRVTELLIKRGADPNLANEYGSTPLHIIVKRGEERLYDDGLAELFFRANDHKRRRVELDARDKWGNTPLHVAVIWDYKEAVEFLLRRGANPNAANAAGATPLHIVCKDSYSDHDLAGSLFEICHEKQQTLLIDARDKMGNTPLHLALMEDNRAAVEFLLSKGADPNLANGEGWTPLHVLVARGAETFDDGGLAELFFKTSTEIDRKVRLDAQDNAGRTPLHLALGNENRKAVLSLLAKGADPNLSDEEGLTPLHLICDSLDDDWLRTFFTLNDIRYQLVQLDARDKLGNTPLHLALEHNRKGVTERLLRRGADPNSANAEGLTPLHIICERDYDDDLVEVFFQINDDRRQRVEIDAMDDLGWTPLKLAVANILPNTVDFLLDRGAGTADFVFPRHFAASFEAEYYDIDTKIRLTAGALIIVEHLAKRGYVLRRDDALTIMKFFNEHRLIERSANVQTCWYNNKQFSRKSKKMILGPHLSLYSLIRLPADEAAKVFTSEDYYELACTYELRKLPKGPSKACASHLCEKASRSFFRRWAVDALMELTKRYGLKSRCCETIVNESFTNEDLLRICLAASESS